MHVVTVMFHVNSQFSAQFREQIIANARTSREREPGCLQFDVCTDPMHKDRIFLYEVYKDNAAFEAHLATAHYKSFEKTAGPWVTAKDVCTYERIDPA